MSKTSFKGFSKEATQFFKGLEKNNNKKWFEANRREYEANVLEPSREFVVEMGKRLQKISPGVHAEPAVNKSLFRLNRDVRFSKDKSPYKTHMAIFFWEGSKKRMECPGYYFHLDSKNLILGTGMYMFPKEILGKYRDAVVDGKIGEELTRAVVKVEKGGYSVEGTHYKKVPRGFDPEHKRAGLLKYNGLYTMWETKIPKEIHSETCIDFCLEKYKGMSPIQKWLVKRLD